MERDNIRDPQLLDHQQGTTKEGQGGGNPAASRRKQGQSSDLGPTEKRMKPSEYVEYDKLLGELANRLKLAQHPDFAQLLKAVRLLLELSTKQDKLLSSSERHKHGESLTTQSTRADDDTQNTGAAGGGLAGDDDQNHNGEIRTIKQSKFTLEDIQLPKTLAPTPRGDGGTTSADGSGGDQQAQIALGEKDELWSALERSARALKLLYLDDQRQLQNQVNALISDIQSITANPKTDPRLLATGR